MTTDKQTFRQARRELEQTIDEYRDIQTDHLTGSGHNLTEANWPPGAIREFDDDGNLKPRVEQVTVHVDRTFDADAPAHRFQAMLDDLRDLGADAQVEVKKTVPGRAPEVRDSGVVIPRGSTSADATATYIRVRAELDLIDDLLGDA